MARTPLSAVVRGAVAGTVGTLAMDLLWYARYRRGGGTEPFSAWEFSSGLTWKNAPAPAQVGKRLAEGLLRRELPPTSAPLVNNLVHWKFGALNGAVYGIVAGSVPKAKLGYGPLFGTAVWLTGYAVLPLAGLYKPIWQYDAKTLAKDWSAHLVYGTTTATVFRVVVR
jgi:hypothetical protein